MTIVKRFPVLIILLFVGGLLRFWHLDAKPLWMDEVITGLLAAGRSYYDIPLHTALPVAAYEHVFAFNPAATCPQIAVTVATQSVHPPLFFCWMHRWLDGMQTLPLPWIWGLRSLPAVIGIVAIAAIAQLNRTAFSRRAAWMGALVMAVSPFAVYLSQEARHYTLPLLFVTLALTGLYHLLLDLEQQRIRPLLWLSWIGINGLGFYIHYFFVLAFAAQVVVLVLGANGWLTGPDLPHSKSAPSLNKPAGWSNETYRPHDLYSRALLGRLPMTGSERTANLRRVGWAIAAVCLIYSPWFPTFWSHINRPETDWIGHTSNWSLLAPIAQLALSWFLMVSALPVENQPFWLTLLSGSIMLLFMLWLVRRVVWGVRQLQLHPATQLSTHMLLLFTLTVVGEFFAIAYLLDKDLTQVPRYNFIYFPAVCALIGAGLSVPKPLRRWTAHPATRPERSIHGGWQAMGAFYRFCDRRAIWVFLLVGLISSGCVVTNQVFQKPYRPDEIAQTFTADPEKSLLVIAAYKDFQDLALGLSFALPLVETPLDAEMDSGGKAAVQNRYFAFLEIANGYGSVWHSLSTLDHPLSFPLNVWAIAPGLKRIGYPSQLSVPDQAGTAHQCQQDPSQYYRLGIPYQLYRCL